MRPTGGYAVMLNWSMSSIYGLKPGEVIMVLNSHYMTFLWLRYMHFIIFFLFRCGGQLLT